MSRQTQKWQTQPKGAAVLCFVACMLIFCSCSQVSSHRPQRIVITGSSTVAPLVAEIGKRFEQLHPNVRIDVQTGGSSRGIADVRRGIADVGMVSREIAPQEIDGEVFSIALDGVGLITHRDNPLSELSQEQIVAIFSGQVRNWKEVGGFDGELVVVNKAAGRSTLDVFLQFFKLAPEQIRSDIVIGDNEQGIKTVAGNRNAIGYVSVGSAEHDIGLGVKIKLLPLNGVDPSAANIRNQSYGLARPLNLITRKSPHSLVREFIEFAQSSQVEAIVKEQNFVSIAD